MEVNRVLKSTEKKEILDLYDDNFEKLYEVIERETKPDAGKNIMLSVVFIKNNDKYLIQKTSKLKGSKYSTTGGHVIHGENPVETIIREVKEELGINVTSKDLKLVTTFKYPIKNCIFSVYCIDSLNIDIKNIILQEAEVEKVAYITKEEINGIINNGNFLESHAYIFKEYIDK